jgi:LPXTG-site transpeptidase (sortase) family protein
VESEPFWPRMRRRLTLIALALVMVLGAACGSKTSQARYVYYPQPVPTTAVTDPPASADPVADGQDDPTPADFVDARPAADRPARSDPPPAPADLSLPRGAIGRVEIPRIGLSQPMFEGTGLDVLANGPGHWTGTALPGDNGNTVVAGHRVTHTHPFLDIDQLQSNDQVIFTTAAGRFVYAVAESFIVTPDATWIANPTPDATMTLFACHPKHEKTHRFVVVGHLVAAERVAAPPAPAAAPRPPASAPNPAPSPSPSPSRPAPPPPSSQPSSPPDTTPQPRRCSVMCVWG